MDNFIVDQTQLRPDQRGQISEAAVSLRLIRRGFEVYRPAFDGHKLDLVAYDPSSGRLFKVQVRGVSPAGRYGGKLINLRCTDGRYGQRRYTDAELDFLVGYDIALDEAFVFSAADLAHAQRAITVTPQALEAWDKLRALPPAIASYDNGVHPS